MVQEYLPEAKNGDVRMFLMNGQPLVVDGMFLVGLDIVGDKLMEVNVFSPGGLGSCQELYDVDFAPAIIQDLEPKVTLRDYDGAQLGNISRATL